LARLRFDPVHFDEQTVALQSSLFRGRSLGDIDDFDQLGCLRTRVKGLILSHACKVLVTTRTEYRV